MASRGSSSRQADPGKADLSAVTQPKISGSNALMRGILAFFVKIVLLLLMVLAIQFVLSYGYDFGHRIFYSEAMSEPPGRDVIFTVESGESTSSVADRLLAEGLISDTLIYKIQVRFYKKIIIPGVYTLNTSMTSKEILQKLDDGP
ncbi:MAG: endolytic transglycosylase MltG [Lachnospiraceae bacterium]|nr:endolytic transglycosylase MltG [Lachnospiraceae bacterium]